ncbi:unnamed protein product [Parnassius apollo]|uniref:(apollo) hypothetical protein n=1 Tax=Parnassius apollo TaxID=110799 RepID=A0A8S3WYR9_PARAO|nr:unnamed protein product [Parnassius apollo]
MDFLIGYTAARINNKTYMFPVLPVTECAVPIDIVTEKLTPASLKKPTPTIIAMIPNKIPIITSTARRVATTNPRRGLYHWWYGMLGYTFLTQIVHYLEVTQYEYFTFHDSYYYQDSNVPFIEKSKKIKLPKPFEGAALPLGQVPPILLKMITPTFHDNRIAKAISRLPPLKYPDYFKGWIGQKKK